MDLRLGTVAASSAERAAVASVLGPAVSRWEGGTRADETEGHVAYGGHEARSRRHLLLPVLDLGTGARPHLRAADHRARRCVWGGHLLRTAHGRAAGAAGDPCLRGPGVQMRGLG